MDVIILVILVCVLILQLISMLPNKHKDKSINVNKLDNSIRYNYRRLIPSDISINNEPAEYISPDDEMFYELQTRKNMKEGDIIEDV